MNTDVYIIFKDGVPFELIVGDLAYREGRLNDWVELFPEHKYTLSSIGFPLLEQHGL